MDITILSAWAQVAASGAVLATLVYLSIKIKQNVATLHSESRRTLVENDRAAILTFLENRDLMDSLHKGDKLSYQDQFRFSLMWLLDMRNREFEYFQYKSGVLDEEAWRSYQQTIYLSFGRPLYRKWWENVGRDATSSDFEEVDNDHWRCQMTRRRYSDAYQREAVSMTQLPGASEAMSASSLSISLPPMMP